MKWDNPRQVFADVTAALEDVHDIAVQGQSSDLTIDMVAPLAGHIRQGLARIETLMRRLPGAGISGQR
ncbi:hypothetical protein [Aurantiacibacter spongiae]|uniref:Uncharacterized protein n=1 Tax=Aurantiacibacter spongiae TaxID=2488860 RepID=A0A3N5DKB6_9SPHN|nr:hypothetical protein [Aurantiacibacter spongiae]RPF72152.1 hypothetical protein EG799_11365 [Aurantiacibacter spongiae]